MNSKNINSLDPEINGRLLPLWVLKNFNKYILPDVIVKDGVDPCNIKRTKKELTLYQEFLGKILDYRSPFKDMLLYHGVGSGKTASAIGIYNVLFNYTPKWNVFILIKASLKNDPWLKELQEWLLDENKDIRFNNIIFIHYDSPYADRDFLEKVKKADSSKATLYIIDEAQNFIGNVYNNISSKQGKRAQVIYDYIQQEKKENNNTRVILISATPAVNRAYEYALYFNLLRPNIFPDNENEFNQIFISNINFQGMNENTKNMFQRRITGLVSYYLGATPDKFAKRIVHYKDIKMNKYYEKVYNHFEKIEKEKEKLLARLSYGKVGDNMSTYSSYTRQSSNFVFPTYKDINGENRPRPGKFRIKDEEDVTLNEGGDKEKSKNMVKNNIDLQKYADEMKYYKDTFIEYLKEKIREDDKNNYKLKDDIKKIFTIYKGSYNNFLNNESKKSNLFTALYECSPKFMYIIFNIIKSKGPTLVYSNYVMMEGLEIFKVYLNFFGFINFGDDTQFDISKVDTIDQKKNFYRYIEFHGGIDRDLREEHRKIFNKYENRYAKIIKIILISPAGTEGITLRNVRQVHIVEPYWNEVRIEQIIGRAHRYCVHEDLPMDERIVDIFRYKMVRNNNIETTDERMESIARKKMNLLESFNDAIKEVAIDCELFKAHNMMGRKYSCFSFNEQSLFEKPPGPAYVPKIEFDEKMNNGLNSNDSIKKRIKVVKIQGVKEIDANTFSEKDYYWYHNLTGVVYDYKNNYPIGKIKKDENNTEVMIDKDVYVIDNLIDIPEFKIF